MPIVRPLETKDLKQVISLFSHLTSNPISFDGNALIEDYGSNCIVIEDDGVITGFAALIIHHVPTRGKVARIEDVVVDKDYQGRGYGKLLINKLLEIAKNENIKRIDLTSKPNRESARKLYESMGFKLRDTLVFRLDL